MKILVIIPVFNESSHISLSLNSFYNQSYKNIEWVLVNDSSTDNSQEIIENFIKDKKNFSLLNLINTSEHVPGAKVVKTFYAGLNTKNWKDFDVIVKLDADIILPSNYFEEITKNLDKEPKVGIIGGLVYIEKNGSWIYENISDKNHVRGPIKTYRKTCFEDIGGLRETLGWDNLDILLARMHGWEIKVLPELKVKHLKPTAQIYQRTKAQKLGSYFYNLGLDKTLALISCAKAAWKERSFVNFFISYYSFLTNLKNKKQRKITEEEIKFIRHYRWQEVFKKLKR